MTVYVANFETSHTDAKSRDSLPWRELNELMHGIYCVDHHDQRAFTGELDEGARLQIEWGRTGILQRSENLLEMRIAEPIM